MTTIIHLRRHGETVYNRERRWQGSLDIPLNEMGREQAEFAAKQFAENPLAAIYSSPLRRAFETAEIIGKPQSLKPMCFANLAEQHFGSLEGKLIAETQMSLQKLWELPPHEQLHYKIVEDMESHHEVIQRVVPTLKEIAISHFGQEVLIVTHGSVMKSLLLLLNASDFFSFLGNCQGFAIRYHSGNDTLVFHQ